MAFQGAGVARASGARRTCGAGAFVSRCGPCARLWVRCVLSVCSCRRCWSRVLRRDRFGPGRLVVAARRAACVSGRTFALAGRELLYEGSASRTTRFFSGENVAHLQETPVLLRLSLCSARAVVVPCIVVFGFRCGPLVCVVVECACAFSPAACDWLELFYFLLVIVNIWAGLVLGDLIRMCYFVALGGVVGMWLFCETASTKGWRKELPLQEHVLVLGSGKKVAGLGGGRREGWGRRRGG